jgi:hypothetical protein
MKTRISVYWPLAVVLTLAALAALQGYGDRTRHEPLRAAELSAELARAVSYGVIDGKAVQTSPAGRAASEVELPRAS